MYQLSRDYNALFDLLLNDQRVACFVDNTHDEAPRKVRDVCLAKRSGPFRVQVSVRGVSYFSISQFEADEEGADERKSFIEGCTDINLEWIVPASMPALNMMGMAAMEEAIDQALERPEVRKKYGWASKWMKACFDEGFVDGFRAGVAWARRQGNSALAGYLVGGVALIATERMLQIEEKGWTPEHDGQHVNFELIKAAMYYCAYDEVAAEVFDLKGYADQIEVLFPSTWADSWKKRRGFPEPTDYDLAKAGALIAAELDRRARERKLNGTSSAVSVLFESQLQDQPSSQAVGTSSQYPAATEEPEDEA